MIGIVLATHYEFGKILIKTATSILDKKLSLVEEVAINPIEDVSSLRDKIQSAILKVNKKKGVIILTDMFGGTPSNISYSFLKDGEIEVLSGVNLPIFLKSISMQKDNKNVSEVAKNLEEIGRQSISMASSVLNGKKRFN